MTPFAGSGLSLLLDAALKGTLVLLAASLLVISMRRGSAASRHLVWQLALLAVLALPLVKTVSPWRLAVLPAFRSPIAVPFAQPPEAAVPLERTETKRSQAMVPSTAGAPSSSPNSVSSSAAPASGAQSGPSLFVRALFWGAIAWLAIAAVLLLRLAFGFLLVRWFALRAYPLYENGWHQLNGELAALIGLKRPVRLLGSPHIATPMTWGATVMLPSAAEDWADERRRVVLLHELAHIRRKDALTHMFAQLACAVYWFHPLVWKAAARMRAEAERACDDLVLRAGTRASVYADHLLELIRTIGGMRTPAVALPMAQRSTFEGRLLAILEPHLDRSTPRPLAVAGMILVVGLMVLPLAGLTSDSQLGATVMTSGLPTNETAADASGEPEARQSAEASNEVAAQLTDEVATLGVEDGGTGKMVDVAFGSGAGDGWRKSGQQRSATAIRSLIAALGDSDADVRLSAAQSLGHLEEDSAVAALSNALRNDSDARVRKMAAWALGNIEDARAVPALTQALKNDRDVEVRRQSAWALGQIEDAGAVPALVAALRDADVEVRNTAVWALGQIESESAVEPLMALTNDANAEVRKQSAWALGQIESASAVPALARLVREDRDAQVRETAAWALGQIESANAVPALSAALKDADVEVRKQAAWALGQIESRPAPAALLEALRDADPEVRSTAAWALAQIEDPGSAAALRGAMRDANAEVRRAVLRALTQLGDEAGYEALAEMLKDPDPEVRKAAAAAMGGRHSGYVDPRPQPRPRPRPRPMN